MYSLFRLLVDTERLLLPAHLPAHGDLAPRPLDGPVVAPEVRHRHLSRVFPFILLPAQMTWRSVKRSSVSHLSVW